jgi:hypothetical protein
MVPVCLALVAAVLLAVAFRPPREIAAAGLAAPPH